MPVGDADARKIGRLQSGPGKRAHGAASGVQQQVIVILGYQEGRAAPLGIGHYASGAEDGEIQQRSCEGSGQQFPYPVGQGLEGEGFVEVVIGADQRRGGLVDPLSDTGEHQDLDVLQLIMGPDVFGHLPA